MRRMRGRWWGPGPGPGPVPGWRLRRARALRQGWGGGGCCCPVLLLTMSAVGLGGLWGAASLTGAARFWWAPHPQRWWRRR